MNERSPRVIAHQPFGNTAGLAGELALDVDEESGVYKLARFLRRKQGDASANLRTGADGRGKTNLVQAVVDGHCNVRADLDCLSEKVTEQRQGQKTMGNAAAEGRFAMSPLRVQVNPLTVLSGFGECLDSILRYDEPVCRGEFASFALFQIT